MSDHRPGWMSRLFKGSKEEAESSDPGLAAGSGLLSIRAAGDTDTGKLREDNEDKFLCDVERRLFVVCDGMGGEAAGEQASEAAVHSLSQFLTADRLAEALNAGQEKVESLLCEALREANHVIVGIAESNPDWEGMGSTVVVALLSDGTLHLANLGDSRAYLVRGTKPEVLTCDHSVAASLVKLRLLSPSEARSHPLRNQLTATLGLPDFMEPAFATVPLQAGDRVVLCSDGLWDMLPDGDIARLASANDDPRAAVQNLIAEANAAGGHDNITAVVFIIGAEASKAQHQA